MNTWLLSALLCLVISDGNADEVWCVHSDANAACTHMPNCSDHKYLRDLAAVPLESNDLELVFCSDEIHLSRVLTIQGSHRVKLFGFNITTLHCSGTSAGFQVINSTNISVENLTFSGCGLSPNNTDGLNGSIYVSGNVTLGISHVKVINSRGLGILMINTFGKVSIRNSVFENNTVFPEVSSAGGGIHIKVTESQLATYYEITGCIFRQNFAKINNSGDYSSVNHSHKNFDTYLVGSGKGGGICIILTDSASHVNISITESLFDSNSASWGGGLYAVYGGSAASNIISIKGVNFTNNSCSENGGGGIGIGFVFPSKRILQNISTGNLVTLQQCNITGNTAKYGGGVAFFATQLRTEFNSSNMIRFDNCNWTNNTALVGAAVDLSSHIWNEENGKLPEVNFKNCLFKYNYIQCNGFYTKGKGAFYSVAFVINFSGSTKFHSNNGSALYLVSSIANFSNGSQVQFIENDGFSGGGIALLSFSALNIRDDSSFIFRENMAKDKGGAIISLTINKKDLISSQICFINYAGKSDKEHRNITIEFVNNRAGAFGRDQEVEGHYGHSIFTTSLRSCHAQCRLNYSMIFDCIANFTFTNQSRYDISTFGKEIKLRSSSEVPLTYIPGMLVELPIIMTDDLGNEVGTLFHILVEKMNNSNIRIDFADAYVERWIRFYGRPGDVAKVTVETITFRQIELTYTIKMQDCPPGYVQDILYKSEKEFHRCVCSASTQDKRYSGIYRCNDTCYTALLKRGYWIGYQQSGEYGKEEKLLAGYCPRDYCYTNRPIETSDLEYNLPNTSSISALDHFICGPNRTGTLCGKCLQNFSSHYHSSTYKCRQSEKCKWGWLLYLISEILPVTILFVVIMMLNIKLTTGSFNAFIYFVQAIDIMLITANGFVIFPTTTFIFVRINRFIARMFNLNFFAVTELSFCLWRNAKSLDLLMFRYVTIVYALFLVLAIVALMRFCNCSSSKYRILAKIQRRKNDSRATIIHGLSGFLILCYSECTRVSLSLLTPVSLEERSNSGRNYVQTVVFYNGEMGYFSYDHLRYALPAIFFLIVFGLIPPLLLLSYPLCYRIFAALNISETRFVSILCKCIPLEKLRPFFDSFQSTFKDRYRFFAGLYFVYRLMNLLSYAFLYNLTEFYLMEQAQLIFILALHTITQPYKVRWHNAIDGLLFMTLAIINAMTLFNYKHATELLDYRHVIHTVSRIQTMLLYVPFFYVSVYAAIRVYQSVRPKLYSYFSSVKLRYRHKDKRLVTLSVINKPGGNDLSSNSIDLLDNEYHYRQATDDDSAGH